MTTTESAARLSPPPPVDAIAPRAQRVRLRDGAVLVVRPIGTDDGERLQHFHARLSLTSIHMRYFHLVPTLPEAVVATFTHVDWINHMVLVATVAGDDAPAAPEQELIGMVNCDRISADAAEVAFVVADAWQGRGVAGILLYDVAACARVRGVRHLLAITLPGNSRMLTMLRHCGFPCTMQDRGDEEEIDAWLDITQTPRCPLSSCA